MLKLRYRRPPEPIEHVEFWIDDENGVPVADIKRNGHDSEALARLMTASPKLLEALKACESFVAYMHTYERDKMTAGELKEIDRAVRLTNLAIAAATTDERQYLYKEAIQ